MNFTDLIINIAIISLSAFILITMFNLAKGVK
jgi:hypothetical protein